MGMDMYIYRCKINPKTFTKEQWEEYYTKEPDDEKPWMISEVFYARKFWEVHNAVKKNNDDYELGDYLRLRRKDIEDMIQVAIVTRNYFENFEDVPSLCEILDHFNEDEQAGWHYWYQCSV